MMTFLEYSFNLEQISQVFRQMVQDKDAKPEDMMKWIIGSVPADFMDKLPDGSRADAALVLRRILLKHTKAWDTLGKWVRPLWDQPVPGPGQTLGRDLLNYVSAKMMEKAGADFFISYSGQLHRSAVHKYTKQHVRVFPSKSNYAWGPWDKVKNTITGDYTSHFNNYRQLQQKNG